MTREEYEAMIDEKLTVVKEELMSEFKEEEPSIDEWKVGDTYFYHNSTGEVFEGAISTTYAGNIHNNDIVRVTHGYAKHTEEEVQFQIERDKVIYELSKFAEPKDTVWNREIKHYFLYWHCESRVVDIAYNTLYRHDTIYFLTEEDAKKAIKEVGEERVKKYYLGVEK